MEEKNSWIQMQKGQEPDVWVVMGEGRLRNPPNKTGRRTRLLMARGCDQRCHKQDSDRRMGQLWRMWERETEGRGGAQKSLFSPETLGPWNKPQRLESEFLPATSNI